MSFKITQIGNIPEEWEISSVEKTSKVIDSLHQTPSYSEGGIPMVRVTDIKDYLLKLDKCLRVTEEVYDLFAKKYKPKKGDIVISRVGTYGVFSYVGSNDKFCLGQNTAIISPNINSKYLYYNLICNRTRNQIDNLVVGSTQKTISLKNIKSLKIPVCGKVEQKAIADTLSALDDKIELNNRINKSLEKMAQAIFKSWFVNFEPFQDGEFEDSELGRIPKGWRVGTLGEIFNFKNGKKRPAATGIYPVYGGNGVLGFADEFNNENVVVIGRVGAYCGSLFLESNKCWISDNAISAKSKTNCIVFCYYTLKRLKLNERRIGTGQPLLTQNILNNIVFTIPNSDVIEAFDNSISPLLKLINENIKQNLILTEIRDSLLPKLMSGEIRVPVEEVEANGKGL